MAWRQFADFSNDLFEVASGFGDDRGIGRDAVNEPNISEFSNRIEVCAVDEKFHGSVLIKLSKRDGRSRPRTAITHGT